MPEILIISGKGGTGKTTVSGGLAHLAGPDKVVCDLDVDAPDLHLILNPRVQTREDFFSGHEAVIDPERCDRCGLCAEKCRFGAVRETDRAFLVDPFKCEGCKVCVTLCPAGAIDFPETRCGWSAVSQTEFGPMVHAQLFPGQENSGKLVALLRQKAKELARERGFDLILADGSPGVGCPVISSLTGVDLAVAVTEPTVSGRHDLVRIVDLADNFRVPVGVVINKSDLNPAMAEEIRFFCRAEDLPLLAEIPFDPLIPEAVRAGRVITREPGSPAAAAIRKLWPRVAELVGLESPVSAPELNQPLTRDGQLRPSR